MYNEGLPGGPPAGYTEGSGMGGGAITALLQLGGSMYDSYQNRKTAKENTDKTIAANKAEAELSYQRQLEMWNRQNLYNSPEAQMSRFIAAGLNPHLIYGQGTAGNASTPPAYQPPNIQYRYEAGNYGQAFTSVLPTLMAVGSWVQNMRLGQAEIKNKELSALRTDQMIEFLAQRNPKELSSMENKLSLFPYQMNMQRVAADTARQKLYELEQNFRQQYGEDLFKNMGSAFAGQDGEIGGMKRLEFLKKSGELEAQGYTNKLLEAKSSWADMDVTDPQAIMMMVMNGVMGLAGQTLRLSTHKNPSKPVRRERPRGLSRRRMGPSHPDR